MRSQALLAGALLALMRVWKWCLRPRECPVSGAACDVRQASRAVGSCRDLRPVQVRGASISGTLYLPKSEGRHPALVWVHGAGADTRLQWGPFLRPFIDKGIAAASFDKRGVGESDGKCCPGDTGHFNLLTADAGSLARRR